MKGPLRPPEAKRLARAILEGGSVIFTSHAKAEMAKEKPELTAVDCVNVLRAGTYSEAEWENGAWRHHARTPKIEVIADFDGDDELVVVTAWRNR